MEPLASRLFGYAAIGHFALARAGRLRNPQLLRQMHRQILVWGIAALPVVASLAAITGAIVVAQIGVLVGDDNAAVQRFLFAGLFFEIAPLVSALVLVARSSGAIAAELAVMHLHDEFTALRRMQIPPSDFVLLPRVWGLALALPAITVLFQGVSIVSGWMVTALLQDQPLLDVADHFLDFADPLLLFLCLAKSTVTGAMVGAIACHHGSSAKRDANAISDASIHAVGNALVGVFLVDLAFALLAWAAA